MRLSTLLRRRRSYAKDVLASPRFRQQLGRLAERLERPLAEVAAEVREGLEEIVTVQNPLFTTMFDHVLGPMHTRAWTIDVDTTALQRLKLLNQTTPLVFLPTHRSYADAFILTEALRNAGLPRDHILGGDNLGFFPLGTIIRNSGGVLVRRSFSNDEVYKFVVREYLGYLVAQGHNLEWYMEGGRSRTGKLRPPKYGLLRYLVDAIESGVAADMLLVPVSMTYDQLHEVSAMAAEEAGTKKTKEGLRWLADYARTQQRWIGTAYVRFGEPLSLEQALRRADQERDGRRWTVEKVAFEVFQRINRVTPVTAPALVTLALLGVDNRGLTLAEVQQLVEPLRVYAVQCSLPTGQLDGLATEAGVAEVLAQLAGSGVVLRFDGGIEPVYAINPGQHAVAAFYRNSAIHWFINRAITELAWFMVLDSEATDPLPQAWAQGFALRDLLKFDFFFSDRETFAQELRAEMRLLDPLFRSRDTEPQSRRRTLLEAPFLIAHRTLTAFLEAYFVVADRLAAQPPDVPIDKAAFIKQCCNVGRQYLLQQRLRHPECVSQELFGNALQLAANRGLLCNGDADLSRRRAEFARELQTIVAAVSAIGALDRQRLPQMIESVA
ncbi:MAG TPA: 1-acyl-sn-glycerol-3-phosphate acyltransferase [Burkholderiaceae bacterium]|nr:1-acyl-sn-glycerol-3-phosphate acyltransferase [Burkholderiaceae bacterium]